MERIRYPRYKLKVKSPLNQLDVIKDLIELIRENHKGDTVDQYGYIDCPICKKKNGIKYYHGYYSERVWMKCKTKECLSWLI